MESLESFVRDIRYVTRALVRTPTFFAITVITLALGIGATTAIYSVINGVLLRPLPYPDPDRIVQLWQVGERGGRGNVSEPNYDDWKSGTRSFSAMTEFADWGITSVAGASEPVRVRVAVVGGDFLRILRVQPIRGRSFVAEEERAGGAPAAMVSERFWKRYLGERSDLSGVALTFDGNAFPVVGVLPATVDFPLGADLWIARGFVPANPNRTAHNWQAIARVADGVTVEQANREISALSRRLKQEYGNATWMYDAVAVPLREQLVGKTRPTLLLLLAASAFLLAIACANVVNLLVARAAVREGELAVRLALGAGRGRIAQQFIAEALVLAVGGGALGVVLATLGVKALLALEPGNLPRVGQVGVDWQVLAFALALSILVAAILGLLSALRGSRGDLKQAMAQAQRTQAGAGASYRVRGVLVIAQVALTLVLLVGAGLLARSFLRLAQIDPGYRTERALVLDISPSVPDGPSGIQDRVRLYDEITARLQALPGVSAVGGVNAFPLTGGNHANGTYIVMSRPDEQLDRSRLPAIMADPSRSGDAEFRVAGPGYFKAMNIPVVRGRVFDDRDGPDAPHVGVISAALAKEKWPNEDPIGKIIQYGNMDGDMHPFTVVGVVGDVRESSLADKPRPTFYASYRQRPNQAHEFYFVVAGSASPEANIPAARRIVSDLRPDVPPRFRTMRTVVSESVADRRFVLMLVGVFGAAAMLLATLGVYSVIAYVVTQRRQEIGVRVALGARSGDVLRMVLRQGFTLAFFGIAIGTVLALFVSRLLSRFLFGVAPNDPVAFGGVIAVLTVVALVASYVPALRATRVDPMTALRNS
ncbi:MAG TPA: ABC transporter permease [Gemmatimonadaceae bacterium]|jgi:predicted permease|nr:ABC transporter permease [Gemmatimonadaceae bacterium]